MHNRTLIGCLAVLALAGCAASTPAPRLEPVAQKWSKVPKDLAAPVVFTVPGMDKVQVAEVPYKPGKNLDVYYPAADRFGKKPLPVVVFVMGYSADFTTQWFGAELKDLGQYLSWGQLVAASGMIGVAYQTDYPDDDIGAVLSFIRDRGRPLGMDPQRIGIFTCSGNTQTGLIALTERRAAWTGAIACGVVYYPVISYFMNKGADVMPAPFKRQLRAEVPLLFVKVGNERPEWKEAVETFLGGPQGKGPKLEVVGYEKGIHGFDTDQPGEESSRIVERTLAFLKKNLGA